MNCQDISDLLDERDIAGLSHAEHSEVEVHLQKCRDCAHDWAVQWRLSTVAIPAMPSALARQCRVLVAAQSNLGAGTQGRRRSTSRLILIGTLAAVAAAAALLHAELRNSRATPAIVAVVAPPAESVPAIAAAGPTMEPAAPKITPAAPKKKAEPLPESPRFTVLVLPLQDRTADEPSRLAVKAFYAALLDGLHAVSGLRLVETEEVRNETVPPEYELTVTGDGPVLGRWNVRMLVKASLPVTGGAQGQRATVPHAFQYSSVAAPSCMGSLVDRPVTGCSDPKGGAASQLDLMREVVFPPDPVLRQGLKVRLQDRTLDPAQRWKALESLRISRAVVVGGPSAPRLTQEPQRFDTETLRGALDLVATAGDPQLRKQIWTALRGVRQPELIRPLIDASRLEASDTARLEAVATLAADYADDANARATLEFISRNDSREIVRMIAQRSLSGDASWNEFVAARLQDAGRTDVQRLEALSYMVDWGQGEQMRAVLDAKAVAALAQLMPRALAAMPDASMPHAPDAVNLTILARWFATTNQPASIDLLIGMLNSTSDPMIRRMAVTGLARHLDDTRARETVEDIAAHDPDPQLRDAAATRQPQLVTPPPGT